jgi:hypothetical protein
VDWFSGRRGRGLSKPTVFALFLFGCSSDEPTARSVADTGGADAMFPGCGTASADPLASGSWISLDERSSYEAESFVAIAPSGATAFAWIAKGCDGRTRIGYRGSPAWAGPSGPISYVESPRGQEASDPAIAFDASGAVHLIWASFSWTPEGEPYDIHIYVASAASTESPLSAAAELSQPQSSTPIVDKPWIISTADGTLIATYGDFDTGGLVIASLPDPAAPFRRTRIEEGAVGTNFAATCPTGSKGGADLVYYFFSGAINEIRAAHTDDGGLTWSSPTSVAADRGTSLVAVDGPTCAARGNDVWICYGRTLDAPNVEVNRLTEVHVAHLAGAGQPPDMDTVVLEAPNGFLLHPQLARAADGSLFVAAYRTLSPDGPAELVISSSSDDGVTWSAPISVASGLTPLLERHVPHWLGDYFGFAPGGNGVVAAYANNAMGNSHIALDTYGGR